MKHLISGIFLLLLVMSGTANADVYDVFQTLFRVELEHLKKTDGNSFVISRVRATAFPIRQDKDYVWLLTAGHFTDKSEVTSVWLHKMHPRESSKRIPVKVLFTEYDGQANDMALLRVKRKDIGEVPILKLAKGNPKLKEVLMIAGCEGGRKPVVFMGQVTHSYKRWFKVAREFVRGISGGPVVDIAGEYIYGIAIQTDGTSVSNSNIRAILAKHGYDWDKSVS
tara:strand:+ start:955 stop:1626 length:672 start_codon:yes stop_codon:yes gene_type:complete